MQVEEGEQVTAFLALMAEKSRRRLAGRRTPGPFEGRRPQLRQRTAPLALRLSGLPANS